LQDSFYVCQDEIEKNINGQDITATANAKRYYKSCLDEKTIEETGEQELKSIINNELGGWHLFDNTIPIEYLNQKLIRLRKLEIMPLFLFYVDANPKDPKQKIIRVRLKINLISIIIN
jgi:predicted metalloendopeptidase